MKTPEQLKGSIRSFAKKNGLFSQEVLQMFLFERVLERLSQSKYRDNFILKGGLLISSMIGINERTTMDMDTTVKGLSMDERVIENIVKEILALDVGDGIEFIYDRIAPIHEDDRYNNFRVFFFAKYGKINNPMKIDITTGDEITPAAIEYSFKSVFEDDIIKIKAYNLETILAEKFETVIGRNISTTRARDFYDLHTLFRIYKDIINYDLLAYAIERTATKRDSLSEISEWRDICEEMRSEPSLISLWEKYCNYNKYASEITFSDTIDSVVSLGKIISEAHQKL